nr:hypothetical protein KPHV_58680 [Kitasatospora purpeofusca]
MESSFGPSHLRGRGPGALARVLAGAISVAALPHELFVPDRPWQWAGHAYAAVDRQAVLDRWAAEPYASQDAAAVTQVCFAGVTDSANQREHGSPLTVP